MDNNFHLTEDNNKAFIKGALNRDDPTELLVGELRSQEKGKGCGTRLLRALEKIAKSRGANKVRAVLGQFEDTDVDALRRFYQQNGYVLNDVEDMVVASKENI